MLDGLARPGLDKKKCLLHVLLAVIKGEWASEPLQRLMVVPVKPLGNKRGMSW